MFPCSFPAMPMPRLGEGLRKCASPYGSIREMLRSLPRTDLGAAGYADAGPVGLRRGRRLAGRDHHLGPVRPERRDQPLHGTDPSSLNWLSLEQCIHGNIVPDFPLCNKSFNQSYSGHDL